MGMEWSQDDAVGDSRIDGQHQKLFELFQKLDEELAHWESKTPGEAAHEICQQLYKYAVFHFAEEEAFMATLQMDSQYQRMHKEEHRFFIVKLDELRRGAPTRQILAFLSDWIKNHIRRVDRLLVNHP